jgi:hypothetical protein
MNGPRNLADCYSLVSVCDGIATDSDNHVRAECGSITSWSSSPSSLLRQFAHENSFSVLEEEGWKNLDSSDSIHQAYDGNPASGTVFFITQALQEVSIYRTERSGSETVQTLSSSQLDSFPSMPSLSSIMLDESDADDSATIHDSCSMLNDSSSHLFEQEVLDTSATKTERRSCNIILDKCEGREGTMSSSTISNLCRQSNEKKDARWYAGGSCGNSSVGSHISSSLLSSPTPTQSGSTLSPSLQKKDSSPIAAKRWED